MSRPGPRTRPLLVLAALDTAALGGWAAARPGGLFALLGTDANADALLLWRLLGVLLLGQAGCLVWAARRPADGGVVLVPLSGRLLLCGVWLWLLGSDRVSMPVGPLWGLFAHDAAWAVVLLGVLVTGREVRDEASPKG
jgi:hypothetical protein